MALIRLTSLRDRLVALILLAALPTLGLALYTHTSQRRAAVREGRETALRFARGLARAHEQRLGEARRLLATLAALPETRAGDLRACGERYAAVLREFPDITTLGVAAAGGDVTCSATSLTRRVNVADQPWFDRAVRTQAFTTGDHELDTATGKAQLVAALPVPYPGGGTQLVVYTALDLGWVGRLAAAELPPDFAVALSDDRGTILARYPDPWRWAGQRLPEAPVVSAAVAEKGEGTAEVAGADGATRLVGFAPVPGPVGARRAYLSVALPRDTAFAAADRGLLWSLIGLGLVATVAIVAAWFGSERMVLRRVKALADATDRLAGGDLDARAEVTGADEIGTLARGLNGMAARLSAMMNVERDARHALAGRVDALVAERTREVELMRQLSELLQACATPDEAYGVMGQLCGRLFPDAAGTILVTPASRDGLWAVAVWGPPLADGRERFQLDDCWALRRGRVYRVDDVGGTPACPHLGTPTPPAYVCVPLAAQGETLGLFTLAAFPGAVANGGLGEARVRLAVTVAEQFALALANPPAPGDASRAVDPRPAHRAVQPPVHGGDARPRAEPRGAGAPAAVAHPPRHRPLQALQRHLRPRGGRHGPGEPGGAPPERVAGGDVACRYGGEEFVLILPGRVARRRPAPGRGDPRGDPEPPGHPRHPPARGVRCSMGVAAFPEHGEAGGTLLRAADAALYRAKREGRDQVVLAD